MIIDECPLRFDGAFGLTKANHSIEFCQYEEDDQIRLYDHFLRKHKLQEVYVRRLIEAVTNNQDPRTTKLFNEYEIVLDHFYHVPCPFSNGRLDLSEYNQTYLKNIPCSRHRLRFDELKFHLRRHYNVCNGYAQKLIDVFKQIRAKHNTLSVPQNSSMILEE
ncbi:unnamed protein product [Rotaria sp. Silwood1]|nr:unnamed protein product [Rotaria sp. Silwood1]CAF3761439.1 unnamed protein product [Rotaria sp. Silwood1]CAF3795427.1 unnamed protein product [Rotaria sp. Silwood1]CAF4613837.1 unnamed protein product [Rotaria sp. Silwood1]CAF4899712.1 unnamed protein product [Rotaria sp. Silwood1]